MAVLAPQPTIRLGDPGTWIGNPVEDLAIEILLADGSLLPATVSFVGNGGNPISSADLDANGVVDSADWLQFRSNFNGSPLASTLSAAQLFQAGDRDGDFDVDRIDFIGFKQAYIAATSPAAFAQAVQGVPEPSSLAVLALAAGLFFAVCYRKRLVSANLANAQTCFANGRVRHRLGAYSMNRLMFAVATVWALTLASDLQAVIVVSDDFDDGVLDTSQWVAVEIEAGQVIESGGTLNLNNGTGNQRPYLATQGGWDPAAGAITFTGTVTLDAPGESFAFWTRSSGAYDSAGQPNNGGVIGSGTRLSFWLGGGANPFAARIKEDTVWPWVDQAGSSTIDQSNLTLVTGDWDVVVTDNGQTMAMTVTNVADPSNTGSISMNTTFVPAVTRNAIVFGNAGASWDNISIDVDLAPPLSLEVNTTTGAVRMQNNSGAPIEIDYYEIRSADGDLVASGGSPLGDYNGSGVTDAADYTVWRDQSR